MHEMGIAQSVLNAAAEQSEAHQGARIITVGVRIGELSGVDTDSLSFCFDCLKTGTACGSAELDVERTGGDELDVTFVRLEVP